MESADGLLNFIYTGGNLPGAPFSYLTASSTSYSDSSSQVEANGKQLKCLGSLNFHQRCSSESFLLEEQPSWLEDLLDDSEKPLFNKSHRRSASDSSAYLAEATETFSRRAESKYASSFAETKANSLDEKINQESDILSTLAVEKNREEHSSKNLEGSPVKPSEVKTEAKQAKQQNAHRSRVRKLQYISHLERTAQNLQAEGVGVLAEIEFVEQQNVILLMENRALKQRLENVSHEQIIKHWEQEMLEREIGRLQTLYNLKKNQQHQQIHHHHHHHHHHHNQQQQLPKHRRNRSRDHIDQVQPNGFFQMNNHKDNNTSVNTSPTGGSVRI